MGSWETIFWLVILTIFGAGAGILFGNYFYRRRDSVKSSVLRVEPAEAPPLVSNCGFDSAPKSAPKKVHPWYLVLCALAVLYIVSPLDAIPDVIPVLGWIDDVGALIVAIKSYKAAFNRGRLP